MKTKIIALCALLLCCVLVLPVGAASPRLADEADLLSAQEEQALLEQLDAISEKHGIDVAVVTADTYDGYYSANSFADHYFLDRGYGQGEGKDGVIMAVFVDDREFAVSTHGSAIDIFEGDALERLLDAVAGQLSQNRWADGCRVYAALCDDTIAAQKRNEWLIHIGLSLVAGFLIALITVSVMKGKLKSVRSKASASDYTCEGSMHLAVQRDIFLFRTVSRRPRPKNTNTGGSGVRSSGGSSFGGGSRRF